MEHAAWFAFGGGLLIGFIVGVFAARAFFRMLTTTNPPTIASVTCLPGGQIQVVGSVDPGSSGCIPVAVWVYVYDDPNQAVPPAPPSGATRYPLSSPQFSVIYPLPPGLTPPNDLAAVWAEYQA